MGGQHITPPTGLRDVVAIAAGGYHSLALKSNGTIVGWGDNTWGQAIPPIGLCYVKSLAGGGGHSLALIQPPSDADTTPPTIEPVPSQTIPWPPNHKLVDISIIANTSDNSGAPVTLTAVVTSNEYIDGPSNISPDWVEPVIDQTNGIIELKLRAERSGSGNGRVYTITITATDCSGNSNTAAVEIAVPHDNE